MVRLLLACPTFAALTSSLRYPRARALGGSTTHNALINIMSATRSDFANLVNITNDSSWSYDNMWEYFKDIEHNLYIPPLDPDHGYTGWLKTNVNPLLDALDPMFLGTSLPTCLAASLTVHFRCRFANHGNTGFVGCFRTPDP